MWLTRKAQHQKKSVSTNNMLLPKLEIEKIFYLGRCEALNYHNSFLNGKNYEFCPCLKRQIKNWKFLFFWRKKIWGKGMGTCKNKKKKRKLKNFWRIAKGWKKTIRSDKRSFVVVFWVHLTKNLIFPILQRIFIFVNLPKVANNL